MIANILAAYGLKKSAGAYFFTRVTDAAGDHWITVRPNGPGTKGQPVLLGKGGEVKGGMGGKFNGKNISSLKGEGNKSDIKGGLSQEEWEEVERIGLKAPIVKSRRSSAGVVFGGTGGNKPVSIEVDPKKKTEELKTLKKRAAELREKVKKAGHDYEFPATNTKIPEGFVRVTAPMTHSNIKSGYLAAAKHSGISVMKETPNAVQVSYLAQKAPQKFEWLPKSQIVVENGYVVGMSGWLAKKNGFYYEGKESSAKRRVNQLKQQYEQLNLF